MRGNSANGKSGVRAAVRHVKRMRKLYKKVNKVISYRGKLQKAAASVAACFRCGK